MDEPTDVELAIEIDWIEYLTEFPEDADNPAARTAFTFGWHKGVSWPIGATDG